MHFCIVNYCRSNWLIKFICHLRNSICQFIDFLDQRMCLKLVILLEKLKSKRYFICVNDTFYSVENRECYM